MTVREFLSKNSSNEVIDILAYTLGLTKTKLLLSTDKILSVAQAKRALFLIKKFDQGLPLAYVLGYKYFYGLKLKVTPNVLIPRPETELLVDKALGLVKSQKSKVKSVLDVGTGSGCIAISIAKNLPKGKFQVCASDVSEKALLVAKQSAKVHRVKIQFIKSDLLNDIDKNFDLVIANLPYLDKKWKTKSIKSEPASALFTSKQGLALIERLLTQIKEQKKQPQYVLLEFDPRQKQNLLKLIKKRLPKAQAELYKDLSGRWRIVEIKI